MAQSNLGASYYNGLGVTKDPKEAVKWFRKAAEQGYANAQANLGASYYNGLGVTKDPKEAVKWYRKAAEQGDATGQYYLGGCYYSGQGVTKNYVVTYAWWKIAVANGHADAKKNKLIMSKQMTPAQVAQAETYAKELIAKNPKLIKEKP